MKKRFFVGILAVLSICCLIFSANVSGRITASASEVTNQTTVTGLEFKNNGLCFSLSDSDYSSSIANGLPGERISEYNYASNIVVYKGEESKTLEEILKGDVYYNMWTVQGTYTLQLTDDWRSGITKVVVPVGTEFPSVAYTGYKPWSADNSAAMVEPTTDEKVSFVTAFEVVFNVDANGNFVAEKNIPVDETEIVIKNLHIRGTRDEKNNRDHCFLIIFLSELDCSQNNVAIGSAMFEFNFLDKIHLWTSETESITLSDAYNTEGGTKEAYFNLWGESDTIAVQLGVYSGESFVKITIDEDCQFPSYEYVSGAATSTKPAFCLKRSAECTPTSVEDKYFVTSWRIIVDNSITEELPLVTEDIAVRSDDFIGIQIRGDENDTNTEGNPHCFIIFYLPEEITDFPGIDQTTGKPMQTAISPARAKLYNTLDNILLWTSNDEYITLRDAYENEGGTKEMYYNIWGEYNSVAYDLGGYHGASFVKITILKGCEFPSYNFTEIDLYPTERKAYTQVTTIDFIDWSTDTFFSTNWRADTQRGVASIDGVKFNLSGQDNMLQLSLSGSDLPIDGETNISTGGLEQIFPNDEFFSNIYIDGVSVREYVDENSNEWVDAYFNYVNYGTIAFNVPGLTKDSQISSIIFRKGFCLPAYDNPDESLREYKVIYYAIEKAIEFKKQADGTWVKQDAVRWTVTFDGQNEILVEDGKTIEEQSYPQNPTKDGYEFIGWYEGDREWRPTDRVTEPVELVAKYKEAEKQETPKDEKGCGSAISSTTVLCVLALSGVAFFYKKKREEN